MNNRNLLMFATKWAYNQMGEMDQMQFLANLLLKGEIPETRSQIIKALMKELLARL